MLQEEVSVINHPSPSITSIPLPASTTLEPTNEHYRALKTDDWYKYKLKQHITNIKLCWEDPENPNYTAYLKLEMQVSNPMLLGSIGPEQPVYGRSLNAQPFHVAEP